jgi:hypothetical protein
MGSRRILQAKTEASPVVCVRPAASRHTTTEGS